MTTQPAAPSLREQWAEEGCCLYRSLLADDEVADLLRITERVRRQWLVASAEDGKPGDPDRHNMRHLNHPAYFRDYPGEFVTLMNLIADERILGFARELLEGEPVFRATTLWFEPRTAHEDGSWHRDVQFLKPNEDDQRSVVAARAKPDGIQLQIALVETSDVEYVPGSHLRWDTDEEYRIRLADGQANSRANDMPGAMRFHLHADLHLRPRAHVRLLLRSALAPVGAADGRPSHSHPRVLPALPRHLRRRPAFPKLSRRGVPNLKRRAALDQDDCPRSAELLP